MRCIVTGGAGFIGSNLVHELVRQKHDVVVLDDLSTGDREQVHPSAHFVKVNLSEPIPQFIKTCLKGIDVVFHLAAFPRVEHSIKNPIRAHNININATVNILKASLDSGVGKFIFSSSSAIYGDAETFPTSERSPVNPMSPYGLHKLVGEQYCRLFNRLYGIKTVSLRYSNVFGPNQPTTGAYRNVLGIFAQQKRDGKPLTIVGSGEQSRDYIHVSDVIQANLLAATSNNVGNGEVINIGSQKEYSVNQIASLIGGPTSQLPNRIEPKKTLLDITKAGKLLKWNPRILLED